MEYVFSMSGNTVPMRRKYQIGAAMPDRGVPVVIGGSGADGIELAATTTAADLVGITVDAQATLVTAQQSDNSDPGREVSVIIDPSAVYKARLSGGSTEGTALAAHTVDTQSTNGLSVETDTTFANHDEGSVFCYSGANAGKGRKITSVSTNHATVIIAFPADIEVGDVFLKAPYCAAPYGMEDQFVQLTTNLFELDASATVDTDNANFRVVELIFKDKSADANRTESFAHIIPFDSIFAAGGSV
jgi:hypothetical protein